ncbi:glycyl-radical enzyme activating protein [Tissierella sp. P1]|uniref:glycyl-radical enzyme activating protein n=1 Tax=Tissierella sp. P1 TaxID=1280483 RepID=UPI0021019191|nr:glycyl-radical enzyme activating protein [Tissierella sp. P1]
MQRCSIHDGPGIRTLVFLKGCPLECLWCANPESQNPKPEISSLFKRCIGCGICEKVCPQNTITVDDGVYEINNELCDNCGLCAEECYALSKQMIGRKVTVDEIMEEIKKDAVFYKKSGGGVTLSGGEPLSQADFSLEVLKRCKDMNIHTSIETSGYCDNSVIKNIAEYLDLIYFDIKHMDSEKHKMYTGVPNERILENLKTFNSMRKDIIVRVPIIPTYNDSVDNIKSVAKSCLSLKSVKKIELLPYHNLGEYKYKSIGKDYKLSSLKEPSVESMNRLCNIIKDVGIDCEVVMA